MTMYLLALLIGLVTGMRTMMGPAAVCWFTHFGLLEFGDSWLGFLQNAWARILLTLAVLGEFVGDQLPFTPPRTVPYQFGARIVSGDFPAGPLRRVAAEISGVESWRAAWGPSSELYPG